MILFEFLSIVWNDYASTKHYVELWSEIFSLVLWQKGKESKSWHERKVYREMTMKNNIFYIFSKVLVYLHGMQTNLPINRERKICANGVFCTMKLCVHSNRWAKHFYWQTFFSFFRSILNIHFSVCNSIVEKISLSSPHSFSLSRSFSISRTFGLLISFLPCSFFACGVSLCVVCVSVPVLRYKLGMEVCLAISFSSFLFLFSCLHTDTKTRNSYKIHKWNY